MGCEVRWPPRLLSEASASTELSSTGRGDLRRSWAGGKVRRSELDTGTGDGGVSATKTPRLKINSALFMGDTVSHHWPHKGCDFYPMLVTSSSPSYTSLPFHVN